MDGRTEKLLVKNMWQFSMNSFLDLIREMNRMYELPVNNTPAANMNLAEQLQNFKKILSNENWSMLFLSPNVVFKFVILFTVFVDTNIQCFF